MAKRKNDIRICHKCRHMKLKSIRKKLQALDAEAKIKVSCQSYCGPCSRGVFIYINGRYVTAVSEDEALVKAEKYIRD